jgi:hypothetical protein
MTIRKATSPTITPQCCPTLHSLQVLLPHLGHGKNAIGVYYLGTLFGHTT